MAEAYSIRLSRVQSRLHCLCRSCPLPNQLLGRLYCTFVLPLLDYCDFVWSPSSVQFFRRFERFHSKFCSLVQGFSCCILVECRHFHVAVVVYRTLHRLSPLYLADIFRYATAVTSHIGRNKLFMPRVRTLYGINNFYYKGTQIWNSLNATIYAATSLAQFKQLYKSIFN